MAESMPSAQASLEAFGLAVPAGHRLTTYAERPDLGEAMRENSYGVWEPFMNEGDVANRWFGFAYDSFPDLQFVLLDESATVVATGHSMPLWWDGTDEGLPDGWDDQVLRSVADQQSQRPTNTLGAMLIVVRPELRGAGHAGTLLGAFRAAARAAGHGALIACVRPNEKERYPLTPIERYATWTRPDGLPFDPWIRLHVRLGGRIARASPRSMTIRGSVADWESWTGLTFPDSGHYVVKQGTSPVMIDRERDEGVYHDQNVWVVHALAGG